MSETLSIGGLAKQSGVHVETIRYYQKRGLLPVPKRPAGGIRRYEAGMAARIAFIKRAQELGFSLDEVIELLRLEVTPGCRDARDIASKKLALVESRIDDLQRVARTLSALIAACSSGTRRQCPIIDALRRTR